MTRGPMWKNCDAARFGFLVGIGRTAADIAVEFKGLTEQGVHSLKQYWGLRNGDARRAAPVPVDLSGQHRRMLTEQAYEIGLAPEEFLRRICVCAIEDKLYAAVTDERFD